MDYIFGGIGLLIAPSVPQYRRVPRLNIVACDATLEDVESQQQNY